MLANNNAAVTTKLARRSLLGNKGKYGIIVTAILLSTFLLFSVLTVGATYFKMQHIQNIRLDGQDSDVMVANGFSKTQWQRCLQNRDIATVGISAYAGYGEKTDADNTLHSGLIWCDSSQWEKMMDPARSWVKGRYPQKENELMVTREVLADCGKENLGVGDSFMLTYTDKNGSHTKEFRISGMWDGYGEKTLFYVSKAFYQQSGYALKYNGILNIKLNAAVVPGYKLSQLRESLNISNRQSFQVGQETEKSIGIAVGIAGLILITCLSAYLLIYNILYLSVSGNIRYYGLLQTVGITEKQIHWLLFKQMIFLATTGMAGGLFLAVLVSFFLIPAVVKTLGVSGGIAVTFHPVIFLATILLTGITLYFCSRKPAKIAAAVSPVEALGYRPVSSRKKSRKTGRATLLLRMAAEQLNKDKKKTAIVLLSLATSMSVFLCLATLMQGQSAKSIASNFMDTDMIIQNDTLLKEQETDWKPVLDERAFEDVSGIRQIRPLLRSKIVVPWEPEFSDLWMKAFYAVWKDYPYSRDQNRYKEHPEQFYSFMVGIDDQQLSVLEEEIEGQIDKKAFDKGQCCVLFNGGLSIDKKQVEGKNVTFSAGEKQTHTLKITALTDDPYYGGFTTGGGPIVIVSSSFLKRIVAVPDTFKLSILYDREFDKRVESEIKKTIARSPDARDFSWESKLQNMEDIKKAQGNMMGVGIGIALVLAWIGLMNYINTVSGTIQNRKAALSIMESVGMTRKQVRRMLVIEGLCYGVGSILLTATVGLGVTYICYQSMNYIGIPFAVPVVPSILAGAAIIGVCVVIPLVAYAYLAGKDTIAKRIQYDN